MAEREPKRLERSAFAPVLRAFSLTEMLVVIAIIVILVALLLPALAHAKSKSQAVACLNNVKQWGLATLLFTEESNDVFPYEGNEGPITGFKNLRAWYNVVPEFMSSRSLADLYAQGAAPLPKSRSVFSCPNTVSKPPDSLTANNAFFMYGFNCRLDPDDPDSEGHTWLHFNRSQVVQPSKTVLLGDNSESKYPTTSGVYAPARHNKRANFTFVDGHSEAVHTNNYWRTKSEDLHADEEWSKPREVYWYPFPTAPE
jgi:prepilin-type processing-associated H-X9-DG protein/prepilin-type N-terminal cleavage/methylation domain-containing protein